MRHIDTDHRRQIFEICCVVIKWSGNFNFYDTLQYFRCWIWLMVPQFFSSECRKYETPPHQIRHNAFIFSNLTKIPGIFYLLHFYDKKPTLLSCVPDRRPFHFPHVSCHWIIIFIALGFSMRKGQFTFSWWVQIFSYSEEYEMGMEWTKCDIILLIPHLIQFITIQMIKYTQ